MFVIPWLGYSWIGTIDTDFTAASCERLSEPLSAYAPDVAAQVIFAARTEQWARLIDFLLRRTLLGFNQDQGLNAAAGAALLLAQELAWSPAHTSAEFSLYQEHISTTQTFRDGASDLKAIG
jgi:glycerol-3-phosphate dehydrogenase